jgi:hypothetical protein
MGKILCPNCGSSENTIMCLTSNPPQFEFHCTDCNWKLRYFDRDNSFLPITQIELDFKHAENKI